MNQPLQGHFEKAGVQPKRVLREVRVDAEAVSGYEKGQEFRVDVFSPGDKVDVVGTSKGRGTQGVMRRHNMTGSKMSHGAHERMRHGGTAGMGTYPGRTPKGYGMPGRLGNERVTVKNLSVVRVIPEENVILVSGAVPGHPRALVLVQAAKTPRHSKAPPA
jgi:large subunit ribosomal protein L3